jgi:tape measure domain-containing protein
MMGFSIDIAVNAPDALPKIQGIQDGLAKAEATAPAVGAAISKALGDSSVAAEKARQSASSLSEQFSRMASVSPAFQSLADAIKREQDMLQQIRGPAQQYMKDLETLDSLLARSAISAEEYANQVTVLNKRIGERPTPPKGEGGGDEGLVEGNVLGALGSHFGEAGALIGGFASKGTLEAGALAGLAVELVRINDEYTELQNTALRFGGSLGTVNDAIDSQLDLAGDLHASLKDTMELTLAVKERTEGLGLTMQQQVDIAKSFGEAIVISGGNIATATESFNRLSFALETGMPVGREFKTLLATNSELLKGITSATGLSEQQFVKLANTGQLTNKAFIQILASSKGLFDQDMTQHAETFTQKLSHTWDGFNVGVGKALDWLTHWDREIQQGYEADAQAVKAGNDLITKYPELAAKNLDAYDKFSMAVQIGAREELDSRKAINDAMADGSKILEGYTDKADQLTGTIKKLAAAINDPGFAGLGKQDQTALGRQLTDSLIQQADAQNPYGALQFQIYQQQAEKLRGKQDLAEMLKDKVISPDLYAEQLKKYQEPLSELQKLLEEINKPQTDFEAGQRRLGALFAADRISIEQYQAEIVKLGDAENAALKALHEGAFANPSSVLGQLDYARVTGSASQAKNAAAARLGLVDLGQDAYTGFASTGLGTAAGYSDVTQAQIESAGLKTEHDSLQAKFGDTSQIQKFTADFDELVNAQQRGVISTSEYATDLKKLGEQYGGNASELEKLTKQEDLLNTLHDKGALSATAYSEAMKKLNDQERQLRMANGTSTFADGVTDAFEKIKKQVGDTGTIMSSTIVSAFGEMNTALESFVMGSSTSLQQFADSFEKTIVDMGIRLAESQLLQLISSMFGAGLGAGAGAASSFGMGAGDTALMVPGGATGLDAYIPHAASGFSGVVGGYGGTDSKLAQIWVTPGETLSVRTPEQMSAASHAANRPTQVHVIMPDNKRALMTAVSSPQGQREVINAARRNRGALRAALK